MTKWLLSYCLQKHFKRKLITLEDLKNFEKTFMMVVFEPMTSVLGNEETCTTITLIRFPVAISYSNEKKLFPSLGGIVFRVNMFFNIIWNERRKQSTLTKH